MQNHKNIKQKSLEWHQIKWGKIGGTLAKGLFVKSDTLFINLLHQHIEEFEMHDSYENDAMERGAELEPFAIEYLEKYLNIKFNATGWLQSDENELLGISPDGITDDETECCEIKCFGGKKHTEIIHEDAIPLDNAHQLVHYFVVNAKLEKLHFFCYRPESKKNFYKCLTLESEINLGTNAKPVVKKISEFVLEARKQAGILKLLLAVAISKLEF